MRISESSLAQLPAKVERSRYDRRQRCGVVHLGVGEFHKAHQAVYFDKLMELGEEGWMITGASLKSKIVSEKLNPQDGLFCVAQHSNNGSVCIVVRSLCEVIYAPDDPGKLVRKMAFTDTKLVTLTITEKGYCVDPESGRLLLEHPDIQWDIAHPESPRSAPGFICAALKIRFGENSPAFTVLSCDNLAENGQRLKNAVIQLANQTDSEFGRWISENVTFPCSMVDRIVPATRSYELRHFSEKYGIEDHALVHTEQFSQWVIEDKFSDVRPPLNRVGVQFTDEVQPWEKAKLRMLNAAHSALAYAGYLMGHEFVHEAISDPLLSDLVEALWNEAQQTLSPVSGFDPIAYRVDLLQRFANPELQHQTYQIAMDGSQKIPQRILASIVERTQDGLGSPILLLVVACWIRWQWGVDEHGRDYEVQDPLVEKLSKSFSSNSDNAMEMAAGFLSFEEIVPGELAFDEKIEPVLRSHLNQICTHGLHSAISSALGSSLIVSSNEAKVNELN